MVKPQERQWIFLAWISDESATGINSSSRLQGSMMPTEIIIIQAFQKLKEYTRLQLERALIEEYKSSKASKINVHFSVICVC